MRRGLDMMRCVFTFAACAFGSVALAQDTATQGYPNKVVRIVTAEPGGGNELAARLISQGLTTSLGQQVIVESRGGGNGAIAMQTVAKAPRSEEHNV